MKPFFSALPEIAHPTLYAFDFDGTLAALVKNPGAARLSARTCKLLEELSRLAPVAVITGRSVNDLKKRLHLNLPFVIGNHGLEGFLASRAALHRAKKNSQKWKRALLKQNLGNQVAIEDKVYSLAVHYRLAQNKAATRARLTKAIEKLVPPPRVIGGKSVINLVQPDAPHKGLALQKLIRKLKARQAVFVGDDKTDEDVFALPSKEVLSVRVGPKKSSRAQYYIQRQSDINRLLQYFIAHY